MTRSSDIAEPVQAATIMLLRDGEQGVEVFMLQRHTGADFGDAHVFPGGLAADADYADAMEAVCAGLDDAKASRELGLSCGGLALWVAAVRECFEESGYLLARAAEIHDEETGNHIIRVNEYSYFLATRLNMQKGFCDEIRYAAQLHDVGKMSVNTAVLTKKGRLNDEERAEMDRHPVYGFKILEPSHRLQLAAEIALNHHEKWDGSGYPNGSAGEDIPVSARIVAMADIYDALRSERPYKPAFSHKKSVEIMLKGDDRIDPHGHFDPKLMDILQEHHVGMDDIYERLKD